jgi:hypothetical protein
VPSLFQVSEIGQPSAFARRIRAFLTLSLSVPGVLPVSRDGRIVRRTVRRRKVPSSVVPDRQPFRTQLGEDIDDSDCLCDMTPGWEALERSLWTRSTRPPGEQPMDFLERYLLWGEGWSDRDAAPGGRRRLHGRPGIRTSLTSNTVGGVITTGLTTPRVRRPRWSRYSELSARCYSLRDAVTSMPSRS